MPTAEINPQGDAISVDCTYVQRDLVKMVPGANYGKNRPIGWEIPLTWASCQALRGVFGDKLTLGPRLHVWGHQQRLNILEPAMQLRIALNFGGLVFGTQADFLINGAMDTLDELQGNPELNPSGRRLYDYQRVDLSYLHLMRRAILGNEPGLGKTGVIIRWLQVLREQGKEPFPALITCPNSLKSTVWRREFALWAPEIKVAVVDGTAVQRRKILASGAEVFIINYEAMKLHTRLAAFGSQALTDEEKEEKELNRLGLRAVVFDEAHRITTIKMRSSRKKTDEDGNTYTEHVTGAQTTRAAWWLARNAEFVVPMTGTPIRNNLRELWTLLHLIDPVAWPGVGKWLERYAYISYGSFGGQEILGVDQANADELYRTLDPFLRRVPKEAALPDLPPVLPTQYRETPMTPAQAKAYREMRKYMLAELADGELEVAAYPIEQFSRLNQFALGTVVMGEQGEPVLTTPSSKIDDMVDVLAEMGDEPLIVAAESRQLIELACQRLTKEGISWVRIVGDQGDDERLNAVQRFQDGKVRVLLLTLGAGAEGITLTRARTMLFLQESWSMVKNQQARDRINRIGAEGHASLRYIVQVTPHTIEQGRVEAVLDKADRLEEIVRDREALVRLLSTD